MELALEWLICEDRVKGSDVGLCVEVVVLGDRDERRLLHVGSYMY